MPSEGAAFVQLLWPKCLLFSGAIFGGGNTQAVPGGLAAEMARGVRVASTPPMMALGLPLTAVGFRTEVMAAQ